MNNVQAIQNDDGIALPTLTISDQTVLEGNSDAALLRDPLLWPFSQNSIWNTPIGSNAKYADVSIGSKGLGVDTDWFIVTKESDPLVPTYLTGAWGEGRATGTTPQPQAQWHPELGEPIHVPYDLIIPDAITSGGVYFTPNNSSAFLHPDGRTLDQFNVTTRTEKGGPLYGYRVSQQDIYGDGTYGGHLGSGLSSIGGSIRKGELLNDDPIRHALKLDIWGQYLNYNSNEGTPGYRWPAVLADSNAPLSYQGTNPALEMGALLATPPSVTAESLGLTTKAGQKIFQALQDYGAYVVDDSGWDYNYIAVEREAELEYEAATGRTINDDAALNEDFNKIVAALEVVDNNSPTSIGGGGTPRQPLAPPLEPTATTGNSSTNALFTVTLSAPSSQPVTVNYVTDEDTATVGNDYTATTGSLTFNPGETSKTIAVPVIGDTSVENDEVFFVSLSDVTNATIGDGQGTGTIQNSAVNLDTVQIPDTSTAPATNPDTVQVPDASTVPVTNPDTATATVKVSITPAEETLASQLELQPRSAFIDLRELDLNRDGQVDARVSATFSDISSDAGYDNSVGLYVVVNEEGAVLDLITGQQIQPGEAGYARSALQQRLPDVNLQRNTGTLATQMKAGVMLAPYLIANGTPEQFLAQNGSDQGGLEPNAYFASLGANPDRADHVRLLGNNRFGFEDLWGGGDADFNDFVFQVNLQKD